MSNDYIYIPGRGTVLNNNVVGDQFASAKITQAQVKAPSEVVFDIRPKDDVPVTEKSPVIVELAPPPGPPSPEPVKGSTKKKAEKTKTESKD